MGASTTGRWIDGYQQVFTIVVGHFTLLFGDLSRSIHSFFKRFDCGSSSVAEKHTGQESAIH